MSRHRNIRSMNYSDEYDGYDDVYGHSVEDDYCISPSDAAFIYDRDGSRGQQKISAFFKSDEDIVEEDETADKVANLDDTEKAKLNSCIEKVKSVLGEVQISEQDLIYLILKHNFEVEKVIDVILSSNRLIQPNATKEKAADGDVPSIKVVAPAAKSAHVTKGFEVQHQQTLGAPGARPVTPRTPRSQSPASRSDSPMRLQQRSEQRVLTPRSQSPERDESPGPQQQQTKASNNKEDTITQYRLARASGKQHLYMVVIGHVDAGKSTLMGHVLCALGQVNQRTLHKYETESRKLGKQSFLYAWVLDETGEERARGITMDVGKSQFETQNKLVTLLDAPGHKDFIPNMISGAGQADVALLVVDATRGEFETGFDLGGQTREHAILVRSLGVSQLAVAVNKLDTVAWSQDRFEEISSKLGAFLKQAGFRDSDVTYVPCSGLTGQNLVEKPTEDALSSWYSGPYLIEVIDNFRSPERPITKPFRFTINDVFKGQGSGFCVSGRIETGSLSSGDRIMVCPTREAATVKSLALEDTSPTQVVFAGDQVTITLSGVEMQNVSVGYVLCDSLNPVPVTTRFEARIVVFNVAVPITRGFPVILHQQSLVEPCVITRLLAQLHKSSGEVLRRRPRCLGNNSAAAVELTVSRPIALERFQDCKELGRVMLRVAGQTIAAGLVTSIIPM